MGRTAGCRVRAPATSGGRYRVWQTMRLLRKSGGPWTTREVAAVSCTRIDSVRQFTRGLVRHGYVLVVKPKQPGVVMGDTLYRLVRDTGPYPPRIRVDGSLFDPNTGEELP